MLQLTIYTSCAARFWSVRQFRKFINMLRFSIMFVNLKAYGYIFTALVLLLYCGLSIATVNAQQAPQEADAPGLIAGIVTDSAGMPLAGIAVSLYRNPEGQLRTVMTDVKGAYRFGLLAAGIYQLSFHDSSGQYALQFYGGAPVRSTATDIVMTGEAVTLAPVTLVAGSWILGTITNQTGAALGAVTIRAFMKVQDQWQLVAASQMSTAVPEYFLSGLPAGRYALCAGNDTITECYDKVLIMYPPIPLGLDAASPISLAMGEIQRDINFTLGRYAGLGEIRGYVANAAGAPLGNITVKAYRQGDNDTAFAWVKTGQTTDTGYYLLDSLAPGYYKIAFSDSEKHLYSDQYYKEADSLMAAQPLAITRDTRPTMVNATMHMGGRVVGKLRLAGEEVSAAQLWFYQQTTDGWQERGFVAVATNGFYTAAGLATGFYRVKGEVQLDGALYQGYHGGLTLASAIDLKVTAGATLTQDLDLEVAPDLFASVISGTVRSAEQPLVGIQVEAISASNSHVIVYTTSDQQGRYQIAGLPNDHYYLRFSDPAGIYAFSWYSDQWPATNKPPLRKEDATSVRIEGATIASGIDGTLVGAGAIQGQVRGPTGTPAIGFQVYAFAADDPAKWLWPSCYAVERCVPTSVTDQQGRYQIVGLPPGRYHVGFFREVYDQYGWYYPHGSYLDHAGDVIVQAGAVTNGIDGTVGLLPRIFLPFVAR